ITYCTLKFSFFNRSITFIHISSRFKFERSKSDICNSNENFKYCSKDDVSISKLSSLYYLIYNNFVNFCVVCFLVVSLCTTRHLYSFGNNLVVIRIRESILEKRRDKHI